MYMYACVIFWHNLIMFQKISTCTSMYSYMYSMYTYKSRVRKYVCAV